MVEDLDCLCHRLCESQLNTALATLAAWCPATYGGLGVAVHRDRVVASPVAT